MEKQDWQWFVGILVQLAIGWLTIRQTKREKPSNRKRRKRNRR